MDDMDDDAVFIEHDGTYQNHSSNDEFSPPAKTLTSVKSFKPFGAAPAEEGDESDEDEDGPKIVVDEDDEENLFELRQWFAKEASVLPSVAKKYAKLLIKDEVGNVQRLAKRLRKEGRDYLHGLGFKTADTDDIVDAMNR
jgi:hypothetical protein